MNQPSTKGRLLTPSEVQEKLRTKRSLTYVIIKTKLPHVKIGDKPLLRVWEADLDKYLADNTSGPYEM